MSNAIQWKGQQAFYVSGTERADNTLRIAGAAPKTEALLRLVLPTLCITYADMTFANDIGGLQENWPGSAWYGPSTLIPRSRSMARTRSSVSPGSGARSG